MKDDIANYPRNPSGGLRINDSDQFPAVQVAYHDVREKLRVAEWIRDDAWMAYTTGWATYKAAQRGLRTIQRVYRDNNVPLSIRKDTEA